MLSAALAALLAGPAWSTPSFVKEPNVLISSAVPQSVAGAYPALRLFFIRASSAVHSATSADGLAWAEEAGARISTNTAPLLDVRSITGCSVLPLAGGGFRMLYSVVGGAGAFRIFSATSADGLGWGNEVGAKLEADGGATFVGSPKLTKLANGDWRLYYIQDENGGNQVADRQIFTALSTNEGVSWSAGSVAVSTPAAEVGASTSPLTGGRVRLYFTSPPGASTAINSALSSNSAGNAFSLESGTRLSTPTATGTLSFPLPVRSTGTFRWRLYYGFSPVDSSTFSLQSAITTLPDPQGLIPNVLIKGGGPTTVAVSGEIFSPGAAVKLGGAGRPDIPGTSVVVSDDQNISAVFDTSGQSTGLLDLTVTNADGQTGTLTNALLIDFLGGTVTLTDNLLRPRLGGRTKIETTIFNPGRVILRLYTLEGRLIRTLLDQNLPEGTATAFWDGRTAQGDVVASGVYLLRALGPKLDQVSKIVIIK